MLLKAAMVGCSAYPCGAGLGGSIRQWAEMSRDRSSRLGIAATFHRLSQQSEEFTSLPGIGLGLSAPSGQLGDQRFSFSLQEGHAVTQECSLG